MSNATTCAAAADRQPPAETRLKRLQDPQVWVCAIAAFTLIGLSSGLLGVNEAPHEGALMASSLQAGK